MADLKVYISPPLSSPGQAVGGIPRVVEAMVKHLPGHGITVTDNLDEADVVNCHAGSLVDCPDKPMVASCHGLYWSDYDWSGHEYDANRLVIETMTRSQAITATSEWVAHALRHGLLRDIRPVYHGVETDEFKPGRKVGQHVLWNKGRADVNSNPGDMQRLAALMPSTPFVTTIGEVTGNVTVIGVVPYGSMKKHIKEAGVYLSTARETFGIGTLEAMACGVPVVGWDFGGNAEIVTRGETGLLVPYGDFEALRDATASILSNPAERLRLGQNARQDAVKRWGWVGPIAQYAAIFKASWAAWHSPRPKVSIVITAYNLARFLGDCIESVKANTNDNAGKDWECIVIDDCSTDDTAQVAAAHSGPGIVYTRTPRNLGLSEARNYGFAQSAGRYVIFLDADDLLHPGGLGPLVEALDADPSTHIAYGNLRMISEDGSQQREEVAQSLPFDWLAQMSHLNRPFYCALMRRSVLEQSGGYRARDWRAEDAAFWCRVTSFGFRARKVTEEPTIYYRLRHDSKSVEERKKHDDIDGDWTGSFGWRLAGTAAEGNEVMKRGHIPHPALVPFGAQVVPPAAVKTWNASHHQRPLVSVIIPVGPGHEGHLIDALDSLLAQTFNDYEAIVINDTGTALNTTYAPWARVINTEGKQGAGKARNLGLEAARAPLVLFLDADDWLLSNGLRDMVQAWIDEDGQRYIYSNYLTMHPDGKLREDRMKPYKQSEWRGQHAVTVLMMRADAIGVGGFPDLSGWEDWGFAIAKAINGVCGKLLPVPTFLYRSFSGERRDSAAASSDDLLPILKELYEPFYTGVKQMAGCGCGSGAAQTVMDAKASMQIFRQKPTTAISSPQMKQDQNRNRNGGQPMRVRMQFTGTTVGSRLIERVGGKLLKEKYRGGNNSVCRYANVLPEDVEPLKSTGLWEVVDRPQPAEAANVPEPVIEAVHVPVPPAAPVVPEVPEPEPVAEPEAEQGENWPEFWEDIYQEGESGSEPEPTPEPAPAKVKARKPVKVEAKKLGVDLAQVTATGKNGYIIMADVRNYNREHSSA